MKNKYQAGFVVKTDNSCYQYELYNIIIDFVIGKDDRLPKPDKPLQPMRSSWKPSVSSTGRNSGYRTEHNSNVAAINFDDIPLHPSWQASIQRKEQQSITQSFQGSRIVFNDSD